MSEQPLPCQPRRINRKGLANNMQNFRTNPGSVSDKSRQQVLCKTVLPEVSSPLPSMTLPFPSTFSNGIDSQFLPIGAASQPMPDSGNVKLSIFYSNVGLQFQNSATLAVFPKSPLRRIVARAPFIEFDEERGTARIHAYLHTLECGHQVWVHPFREYDENWKYVTVFPTQKRHRCAECKALLDAKKPPQSVTRKNQKKEIA